MLVDTYRIQTKAFTAEVRVQNGRVVQASPVLKSCVRLQAYQLKKWLNKNFPQHTMQLVNR